jgi:hypothetical protein
VYWRAFALLAAALVAGGCHGSNRRGPEPAPRLSFRALDAQQQRLVGDYEPVSRALTSYERSYRAWRAGRVSGRLSVSNADALRGTVALALRRIRRDRATGETARAKELLIAALTARRRALGSPLGSKGYLAEWNRSVVDARRALTLLQDIRDRARLIPLPEDSVS